MKESRYVRRTLADFLKGLEAGEYKILSGARRSVGRSLDWSTKDQNAGYLAIDEHFKVSAEDRKYAADQRKNNFVNRGLKRAKKRAKKGALLVAPITRPGKVPVEAVKKTPVTKFLCSSRIVNFHDCLLSIAAEPKTASKIVALLTATMDNKISITDLHKLLQRTL